MAISVRRLAEPDLLAACTARFEQLVGVSLPAAYLARAHVYGCFNTDNRLVGGYAVVATPPYRGVVFLPDTVKQTHWFFKNVSMNNVLEVNGVWLERRVRLDLVDLYAFWWQLVRSLGRSRKRYVLVWYNRANRHLHRFYSRLQKEMLYTGASAAGHGTTHREICVAYTTRTKLYCSLIRYLPRILKLRLAGRWRGFVRAHKTRRSGNNRR